MKNKRPLIRQTFMQERFDILIKKQLTGTATFNDLTELDDIVNRDPEIRECILEEMQDTNFPVDGPDQEELVTIRKVKTKGLLEKVKALIIRLLIVESRGQGALLTNLNHKKSTCFTTGAYD